MLVTNSLTDSALTHSRLVNLFDVTLACEDAYSKIVEVADVDDENRVKLATVCCRFGSRGLVIKQNFCSDFQHKVRSGV